MSGTLNPSQQFGRYKIVKLLGSGAMGSVYLARDIQLERDVALKVPQFAEGKEPQILARFYQEARAAATIHHPHVCPVFDVGEIDGVPYLTMAYIEGKPLEEWVGSGKPLNERQIATIGRKVAEALSEAHKKGVIHRDLKPANIMIDKRGEPIVMDFGLAQRARDDNTRLTRVGTVMGSPSYMSPEQIKGETDTTGPGTDVFSLGVILYELLARRLPFDGDSVGAVHAQILLQEPPPLCQLNPEVSPALEAICMKALAKKAEDRHKSMGLMAAAIKGYLNGSFNTPSPSPAIARPSAPPPPPPAHSGLHGSAFAGRSMVLAQKEEEEARREQPKRKKKQKKEKGTKAPAWMLIGGTGGIVIVAVVALVFILRPPHKPDSTEAPTTGTPSTGSSSQAQTNGTGGMNVLPPGYHALLNNKDLTGWVVDSGDPSVWRVDHFSGELKFDVKNLQPQNRWLITEKEFTDYILRLDFQISDKADSGVSIHQVPKQLIPLEVQLSNSPVKINGKKMEPTAMGALYLLALDHAAPLEPPGKWNTLEVSVKGESVGIKVNGKDTVVDASLSSPAAVKYLSGKSPRSGRIGLQAYEGSGSFRNIAVMELAASKESPAKKGSEFVSLINGKDYKTDWEEGPGTPPNSWKVENGELISVGADPTKPVPASIIFTRQQYSDFDLHFDFKTSSGGLSGVLPKAIVGLETQIGVPVMDDMFPPFKAAQDPTQTFCTGSLRFVGIDKQAILNPIQQWNSMEVRVRWPHIRVKVNEQETVTASLASDKIAKSIGMALPKKGKIGLVNNLGTVHYRKLVIQELSNAASNSKNP